MLAKPKIKMTVTMEKTNISFSSLSKSKETSPLQAKKITSSFPRVEGGQHGPYRCMKSYLSTNGGSCGNFMGVAFSW